MANQSKGGKHHERGERENHSDRRGRDRSVFLKIVRARWIGSDAPTAQAYARGLAQWRQLPGSIATTTTDLTVTAAKPAPADDADSEVTP